MLLLLIIVGAGSVVSGLAFGQADRARMIDACESSGGSYRGAHSFAFGGTGGKRQAGEWVFEPVDGTEGPSVGKAKAQCTDFLFDDLRPRVAAGDVAFDLNWQLAQPTDRLAITEPEDGASIQSSIQAVMSLAGMAVAQAEVISASLPDDHTQQLRGDQNHVFHHFPILSERGKINMLS